MTKYIRKQKKGKRELIHRNTMEKELGRKLKKDQIVHHIDGNIFNNKIENLQVTNRSKHASLHQQKENNNNWKGGITLIEKEYWKNSYEKNKIKILKKKREKYALTKLQIICQ